MLRCDIGRLRSDFIPCVGGRRLAVQDVGRITFKRHASENIAHEGAGINVDAVGQELRTWDRRMTVNDNGFQGVSRSEKRFADPKHVLKKLTVEGNARANARMDKEIIAAPDVNRQGFQEWEMRFRQNLAEVLHASLDFIQAAASGAQAVRKQGFRSTPSKPMQENARIIECAQHHVFVIAPKHKDVTLCLASEKEIDNSAGIGPSVDIVSEIDLKRALDGCAYFMCIDQVEHGCEEIGAAVHVSHGIDADPSRQSATPEFCRSHVPSADMDMAGLRFAFMNHLNAFLPAAAPAKFA